MQTHFIFGIKNGKYCIETTSGATNNEWAVANINDDDPSFQVLGVIGGDEWRRLYWRYKTAWEYINEKRDFDNEFDGSFTFIGNELKLSSLKNFAYVFVDKFNSNVGIFDVSNQNFENIVSYMEFCVREVKRKEK